MTSTHTHTVVSFADPHLVCGWCAATVAGYRHAPGHDEWGFRLPWYQAEIKEQLGRG